MSDHIRRYKGVPPLSQFVTAGFDISAAMDPIAIQIGGGDSFANASLRVMKYSINSIG